MAGKFRQVWKEAAVVSSFSSLDKPSYRKLYLICVYLIVWKYKMTQSSYRVLARRLRPKTFSEVVGQDFVCKAIKTSLDLGRLAHAILLSGPRGAGKTTIARIIAKCLNCAKGTTSDPCSGCEYCKKIENGALADVLEIDAASNRSIEDIRGLKEFLRYAPYEARSKIVILDEVHMLTQEAFNALLKVLEEPASNVYFVLATTEIKKIPKTVISRCQRYHISPLSYDVLLKYLTKVAKAEQYPVPSYVINKIALKSQGSVRDGLVLLEEVACLLFNSGGQESVEAFLGFADEFFVVDIMEAVGSHDSQAVLKEIESLVKNGVDLVNFYESSAMYIRNLIVYKICLEPGMLIGEPDIDRLGYVARLFETEQLVEMLEMFMSSEQSITRAKDPRIAVETLFIRLSFVPNLGLISSLFHQGVAKKAPKETKLNGLLKQQGVANKCLYPVSKDIIESNLDYAVDNKNENSSTLFCQAGAKGGQTVNEVVSGINSKEESEPLTFEKVVSMAISIFNARKIEVDNNEMREAMEEANH